MHIIYISFYYFILLFSFRSFTQIFSEIFIPLEKYTIYAGPTEGESFFFPLSQARFNSQQKWKILWLVRVSYLFIYLFILYASFLFLFFKEFAILPQMAASYQSVTGWYVASNERQFGDGRRNLDSQEAPIKMADDLIRLWTVQNGTVVLVVKKRHSLGLDK